MHISTQIQFDSKIPPEFPQNVVIRHSIKQSERIGIANKAMGTSWHAVVTKELTFALQTFAQRLPTGAEASWSKETLGRLTSCRVLNTWYAGRGVAYCMYGTVCGSQGPRARAIICSKLSSMHRAEYLAFWRFRRPTIFNISNITAAYLPYLTNMCGTNFTVNCYRGSAHTYLCKHTTFGYVIHFCQWQYLCTRCKVRTKIYLANNRLGDIVLWSVRVKRNAFPVP